MGKILRALFNKRMLCVFLFGVSSGLPLLLIGQTLKAWMTEAKVDLTIIGIFSLATLPYSLKFFWAPFMDRFAPFMGRRRGWIVINQLLVALGLIVMACLNPAEATQILAFVVLLVAFFSASQDIALDAYRREILFDDELGLGSAMAVNGYRIGMYIAGGIALILADHIPWRMVYITMAAIMIACTLVTFIAPEPQLKASPPRNLRDAVYLPFKDFLRRAYAWEILAFILIYKLGDSMASDMFNPLYLNLGYTKTQIGAIAKTFGFWCSIGGGTIGGLVMVRLGIMRSLWIFGITQTISTFGFCVLSQSAPSGVLLGSVISFETLCTGAATSAFVAFISSLCNPAFTATQFALLSSLMSVPRTLMGSSSGYLAKHLGWFHYYILCTFLHLPGLLLLLRAKAWKRASQDFAPAQAPRAKNG